MKKLFKNTSRTINQLVILVFVAIGVGANAQYPYNFSFAGVPHSSKTIVRSYDQDRVVVYYEEGGKGYVSLVNVISNDVYTVSMDVSYVINDMCIMHDSVFLCGYYIQSGTNIIGAVVTMNLNSFYSSPVHVTYYNPSYWLHLNLKRIKKFDYMGIGGNNLAKFLMVADIYYACDGTELFPIHDFEHYEDYYVNTNDHSRCTVNAVVELSYPFTYLVSSLPQRQKVVRVMNPTPHPEIIHDVVVTDNYVAFVGVESGTVADYITLHICNRGGNILNPSNSPYYFDNYYTYSLGTNSGTPFYHACALDGDMIAIVTQDETSTSSNDIIIRTFDLATHTMTNAQSLQCYSHPDLKDVSYIPDLHRLVLLYYGYFRQTGTYSDIFCTADPYNVSPIYTMPGITDNVFHSKFGSLDAMKYGYFIATGGKYGFAADAGVFTAGRTCYDMDDFMIINKETISAGTDAYNYDLHLAHPIFDSTDVVPVYTIVYPRCVEF